MSELLDRAELFNRLANAQTKADCFTVIQEMPESIVRCRDCTHSDSKGCAVGILWCDEMQRLMMDTEFCSAGEREKKDDGL